MSPTEGSPIDAAVRKPDNLHTLNFRIRSTIPVVTARLQDDYLVAGCSSARPSPIRRKMLAVKRC